MKRKIVVLFIFILMFLEVPVYAENDKLDNRNDESINNIEDVKATDIEISSYENKVKVGSTINLNTAVLPSESTDKISYRSSNTNIAFVNSTGEVTGISKGNVVIYIQAGEIIKEVIIEVYVATTNINVDNEYIVLKKGNIHKINAQVIPDEASNKLSYKSSNTNVATVSSEGVVKAINNGNATIIINNGDYLKGINVIVNTYANNNDLYVEKDKVLENKTNVMKEIAVDASIGEIDESMLQELYDNKQTLKIIGKGYDLYLDGKDIINVKNVLKTDIILNKKEKEIYFSVNEGNELCGKIRIKFIDEKKYPYLYLYNKKKYVMVNHQKQIIISKAGKYVLRQERVKSQDSSIIYMLAGSALIVTIILVIYIVKNKRYIFW